MVVKSILDQNRNTGTDVRTLGEILQQNVGNNFCDILSLLCDGQYEDPFYMTVWQELCAAPSEMPQNSQLPPPEGRGLLDSQGEEHEGR